MTLFKNIKWMIFGSIGYRFRGFLIGVAVGFGIATFAPTAKDYIKEYLSWVFPTAYAAPYYDFNALDNVDAPSGYAAYSIPLTNDTAFARGEQVQANSDGTLTHVQMRILRNPDDVSPITLPGTFSIEVYEATAGGHVVGALLGQSADYDPNNLVEFVNTAGSDCDTVSLDTDCPSTTYSIFPEFGGALDFTSGDLYWIFVEYYDGDGDPVGGGEALSWVRSPNTSDGLYIKGCTLLPATGCTQSDSSGSGNDLKLATIFDDGTPFEGGIFGVGYGPHISLDPDTYELPYFCNHAGDIWGYDSGVDSDYQDLGISCLSGDNGYLTLDLSGSLSEWSFQLVFDGLPIADAAATIYYNPNNAPVLPPDGADEVDLGFCLPFLTSDEEVIEPELNVDEEISSGFLAWAKGVALAAFSGIYGQIAGVPLIGDYMVINCVMYEHFVSNLDSAAPDFSYTVDFDTGFMGMDETDTFTLDMGAAYTSLEGQISSSLDSDNYDGFRYFMTVLFIFLIFWKVFSFIFGGHRSHDDEDMT